MAERALIDLQLTLDGEPATSEMRFTWAGPYILCLHTVIPQAGLALELHSAFAQRTSHRVATWAGPSPASTEPIGRHSGSKRSMLLAGNARAAERPIRASETLGADDKHE